MAAVIYDDDGEPVLYEATRRRGDNQSQHIRIHPTPRNAAHCNTVEKHSAPAV